jgi:hypothetical protein
MKPDSGASGAKWREKRISMYARTHGDDPEIAPLCTTRATRCTRSSRIAEISSARPPRALRITNSPFPHPLAATARHAGHLSRRRHYRPPARRAPNTIRHALDGRDLSPIGAALARIERNET